MKKTKAGRGIISWLMSYGWDTAGGNGYNHSARGQSGVESNELASARRMASAFLCLAISRSIAAGLPRGWALADDDASPIEHIHPDSRRAAGIVRNHRQSPFLRGGHWHPGGAPDPVLSPHLGIPFDPGKCRARRPARPRTLFRGN